MRSQKDALNVHQLPSPGLQNKWSNFAKSFPIEQKENKELQCQTHCEYKYYVYEYEYEYEYNNGYS